jgi:hypothetical protein
MKPIESAARFRRKHARNALRAIVLAALALAAGCASFEEARENAETAKLRQLREAYAQCVSDEAEKEAGAPARAEDLALAAHGRCWTAWDVYRQATYTTFAAHAKTPDEKQLAHDKADAQLRQAELETRRAVVERIIDRAYPNKR